jgi:hypothetical protein
MVCCDIKLFATFYLFITIPTSNNGVKGSHDIYKCDVCVDVRAFQLAEKSQKKILNDCTE